MNNRPNILYVFADEYRQRALGFRNEDPVYTPNFDKFAKDGFELTNVISNFPVCSPYRGMLFTGTYPWTNGVYSNCHSKTSKEGCYLKARDICISDTMRECGYDAGYIGKWHLDPTDKDNIDPFTDGIADWNGEVWDSFTPKHRRHNFNFWYAYGCSNKHLHPHYFKNDGKPEDRIDVDQWSAEHETDIAIDYINNKDNVRDESKPFILFMSTNPPHMPFNEVPEKYRKLYKDKTADELLNDPNVVKSEVALESVKDYFAAVSGIDDQFGRLLQALSDKGIRENTIVIFTADHGEMMGSHDKMGKNLWYRESVNVPFLIQYPKINLKGKSDEIVNIPDIFPTLMDMVGLKDKIPQSVEGVSVKEVFNGGKTNPYAYYGINVHQSRGVISQKYTYAIRHDIPDIEKEYLFDNENDPYQMNNLADVDVKTKDKMKDVLREMCLKMHDPWLPR